MMWLVPLLFTTLVAIEVDVYADKEKQLEKRHLSLEPNETFIFKVYGDNIHLRLLENTIDCDYAELLLVAKEHVYGPFCNKKRKRRSWNGDSWDDSWGSQWDDVSHYPIMTSSSQYLPRRRSRVLGLKGVLYKTNEVCRDLRLPSIC